MILLSQLAGEEKILYSRFRDAINAARLKNQMKFIGFLDIRQQEILKTTALSEKFSSWRLFGGFPEAERKVAGFFPDYIDWEESSSSLFPVVPITARFREQDKLSHRDFLGSLMSLRISREMIGDILVGNGIAVFFVLNQAVSPILSEIKKVGQVGVHFEEGAKNLELVRPVITPLSGTVHSQRLDAVVSFLTRLSREKAQELIRQEWVKVDGQIRTDLAGMVEEKRHLSIRGYGKYVIYSFDGITKKGRLRIAAGHYQ
ncbi:MAG TPA: RNA-binding protein [Ruminococcaceae bacterium]|nr:RNA-binding protein [Oscillospiraceae bacterium]HCB65142.1 RNA-binding protein [Oscillospiraceae bacterium]